MGGTYRNNDGAIENLSGGNIVDAALDKTSDHAISNAATATKFEEIDEAIGDTDISDIGDGTVTGAIDTLDSDLGSKTSASTVTGDDAFSKIAALNTNKLNAADMFWTEKNFPAVTVPNNTYTKIGTITLPTKGLYIVRAVANWLENNNGGRFVGFAQSYERNNTDTRQAANGMQTIQSITKVFNSQSDNQVIDIYGNQTSGGSIACYPYCEYIKLK